MSGVPPGRAGHIAHSATEPMSGERVEALGLTAGRPDRERGQTDRVRETPAGAPEGECRAQSRARTSERGLIADAAIYRSVPTRREPRHGRARR